MSFLSRLFKGPDKQETQKPKEATPPLDYNGYQITADPIDESGQWRLSGTILKTVDGETREHSFIRADTFPSENECREFTLRKGKQLVDQMGDSLFGEIS
ncbi:HlyU family transcriptional regulator [Flexibacterium corallicola]|uniref:HlyU family transcriptional regulator n=1 Tax=Flexibacterium corallicola TaxID=3037259 RepID=UPI00286EFD24|nr:HlyU family transcriptional regulator [Pseudovibrio sp. M1P-2-3]